MARDIWPAVMLSLALGACSGEQAAEQNDEEKEEGPAIPVEVSQPTRGDIYATYSGTAPIEAYQDAQVIAKVAGELLEILVEEGDDVHEGQVLARLDDDRLRLEAERIEADLQKLRRDYQRNVDLREKSLISAGDFEKIQFEMEALEAAYKLAILELSYTEIKAPITGVISERFVKTGSTLEANTPLFQITSLEPLVSYVHVPEREYRRLEAGQSADIEIDALRGEVFTGRIARVSPVVDPETGTFKITIEVSDSSRRLKPGMFGRVTIVHDRHENALMVPRNAIVEDSGNSVLYVVEDGKANRRSIRTGYAESGMVEILDGLTDGETFVVVGQTGLKDGSRVSIIGGGTMEPAEEQAAAVE